LEIVGKVNGYGTERSVTMYVQLRYFGAPEPNFNVRSVTPEVEMRLPVI